jgi:Flp pilus assembly protein TadD
MNQLAFQLLRVAALLLALLLVSANSPARGEDWPGWMGGSKSSNEFESQLSMARLNERHGQFEAAMKIYNAVLEKQPNNQLAHHRIAIIAATNGEYATADQHFSSALKIGPRTPDLMCDVAYCLFLQNRLDESEEALRRILTETPTHKKAHNTLGMVLGLKGRFEESLNEFRQVVGEAEAHANLAFVMVQTGDLEQANKHYHEAVRLDPALRPAVEALVQLNGHTPIDSSKATSKPAASANRSSAATASAKGETGSMAKPTSTRQTAFALKQPPSQQVSAPTAKPMQKNEPGQLAEKSHDGRQSANPIPEVAQQLAPQSPVVPKQSETSFGPATMGFANKNRLIPGIQASSTAHGEMIAKHERADRQTSELAIPSMESKPASPSEVIANAPVPGQQDPLVATIEDRTASTKAPGSSLSSKITRAQVFDYPPPQAAQVAVSDESPAEPTVVEISDQTAEESNIATVAESAEAPAAVLTPGSYALAAARAQANLLTEKSSLEPGIVAESSIHPLPLAPAANYRAVSQATQIPFEIPSTNSAATPASFVVSAESIPAKVSDEKTTSKSTAATPSMLDSLNSLFAENPPAPWKIVLMTLGGVFGLVVLGKTTKRLVRGKVSPQPVLSPGVPQSRETFVVGKHEAEETYTYLESQIRDVCAGLPSGRRSADGARLSS